MQEKIKAESLKPGDLWRRNQSQQPWIFLGGKEFKCSLSGISLWELTWFGRKNTDKLELIIDIWTADSKFLIISKD